ncbi:methionyl-tRNA formyltransferase [Parvimonas sp. KA00067]|uniref:methionyl-tRNA formyltransferase n=1 Tax=Parvimonas sp. KA00067 TaxID=1588755 RepID=UPI00061D810B|nr:methionyl-tRNA formyltransferase [Parvimonas sp. KA00067]KXB66522.1 methionyl-tRNA formyltransferase [Parvimonas sp. KA00067]
MKKIIFMGTPDFAVPPLEVLNENFEISLVVSQKDKLRNRKKLLPTPVKQKALELGLEVITPDSVKSDEFFEIVKKINPDFIVVVAFGQIIDKRLIDFMGGKILNIHASILPELRGSAPINWAIVNGLEKTGVSIMSIDVGLDTGDVLDIEETEISDLDNAETLYERLSKMGSTLIVETMNDFENKYKNRIKQGVNFSYAPMIKKEMGKLNFNDTSRNIFNKIRGFYNWPSTFCEYMGENIKVHRAEIGTESPNVKVGTIFKTSKDAIFVKTLDGSIKLLEIQFAGKKRVLVKDYLRGNSIKVGEILS